MQEQFLKRVERLPLSQAELGVTSPLTYYHVEIMNISFKIPVVNFLYNTSRTQVYGLLQASHVLNRVNKVTYNRIVWDFCWISKQSGQKWRCLKDQFLISPSGHVLCRCSVWQYVIQCIFVVSIPLCYIKFRSYTLSNTTRWMLIHFNTYFI
jgi:hypothetical protein